MASTRYAPSTLANEEIKQQQLASAKTLFPTGVAPMERKLFVTGPRLAIPMFMYRRKVFVAEPQLLCVLVIPQSNELSGVYVSQVFTSFVGLRSSNQPLIFTGGQQT